MSQILTDQDFANAKRDISDIDKAVNTESIVDPRWGGDFKSLPLLSAELEAKNIDAQSKIDMWQEAITQITVNDGVPALAVSTANGNNQQVVNDLGGVDYWSARAYQLNNEVRLDDGTIVISTIDNNSNNPNLDMTGWVNPKAEQEKINNKFKDRALNLDDFKTGANTDADAFYAMLAYAKEKGIKSLDITRDITLDQKITLTQDSSGYLNNLTINTNGFNIHYTGLGANSLYVGVFEARGVLTNVTTTVVGDHAEYTSDLTVASVSGFSVGDYILIRSTSTTKPHIYLNHVVKIESITGNTIQTDTIRRLAALPSIAQINVTKVNTVNNFKLVGNSLVTAANQTTRSNGISAVILTYASASQVIIKSTGLWFKTISANNCHRCTIIGENKYPAATGGGEGYCVQLQYCTHSIAKGLGEYLRHTTDCTASWHCAYVDSFDYYAFSGAFIHHCAFEYNIKYFNCHSYASETVGFALGSISGSFGDYSENIEMINCGSLMSKGNAITFANKGKGLTIRGGVFDADNAYSAYSLLASNNDTKVFDAKLLKGIQCTTSIEMYTGGVFELYNTEVVSGTNTRTFNITTGRSIKTFNCLVDGRWAIADSTTVELNNTTLAFPANAQLIASGGLNQKLIQNGGKQIIKSDATVSPSFGVAEFVGKNIELDSGGTSRTITNTSNSVTYNGCTGSGALVVSGSTNVTVSNNSHVGNGTNIPINITGVTGTVNAKWNTVGGASVISLNIHSSCQLSRSNISGNTTVGRLSIPDASFISGIVKNNIVATGSTVPTASTIKLVSDNLLI